MPEIAGDIKTVFSFGSYTYQSDYKARINLTAYNVAQQFGVADLCVLIMAWKC